MTERTPATLGLEPTGILLDNPSQLSLHLQSTKPVPPLIESLLTELSDLSTPLDKMRGQQYVAYLTQQICL